MSEKTIQELIKDDDELKKNCLKKQVLRVQKAKRY